MDYPIQLHTSYSDDEFIHHLQFYGTCRYNSRVTHLVHHHPTLSQNPTEPIETLLLGDSILEHLKDVGKNTPLGSATYPSVMNAGVGGDKISNVLYRLGAGLWRLLAQRSISYAVLQIGTNNLSFSKGIGVSALMKYALVIEAIRRASPRAKILVTGLMPRTDVLAGIVAMANKALENLVREYNAASGGSSVFYLPRPAQITIDHLIDHIHLNEAGYAIFVEAVEARLEGMGRKRGQISEARRNKSAPQDQFNGGIEEIDRR